MMAKRVMVAGGLNQYHAGDSNTAGKAESAAAFRFRMRGAAKDYTFAYLVGRGNFSSTGWGISSGAAVWFYVRLLGWLQAGLATIGTAIAATGGTPLADVCGAQKRAAGRLAWL